MPQINLDGKGIVEKFTAEEAITKGDVVYISAANEVKKAASANARQVIGVANRDASAGAEVEVIIYGKAEVTADGAISAGDSVIAAAAAGRVIAENSVTSNGHTHTENLAATYTQNATTAEATDTVEHSRVLGVALGGASAGDKLMILVCLRG